VLSVTWNAVGIVRLARGLLIAETAIDGAVPRLRPIMMTTLGLLPAALSHEIGSDLADRAWTVYLL